jgi:O-antigen ligase
MRLSLTLTEFLVVCLLLFFGTLGYLPILMPNTGGALTAQGQMTQVHTINHVVLALVWGGIFLCLLQARFRLRLDLLSAKASMAYGVFAISSVLWSAQGASSFSSGISLFISTAFAIYLVSRFDRERLVILLSWMIFILASASALFAVALPRYGIDHFAHTGALQGVYGQKNALGLVMVYGIGIALSLTPRTFVERIWKNGLILLCIAEAGLSESREAWVAGLLVLILYALLKIYTRFAMGSRSSLLVMFFGVVAVAGGLLVAVWKPLLSLLGRDPTLTGRTDLWEAVLERCANHPLSGYGLGTFWGSNDSLPISMIVHWVPTSAHNGFLECLLELGAIGLLLLLFLIVYAMRNSITILTSQAVLDHSKAWMFLIFTIVLLNMTADITGIVNSISWLLLTCSACALEQNVKDSRWHLAPPERNIARNYNALSTSMQVDRA